MFCLHVHTHECVRSAGIGGPDSCELCELGIEPGSCGPVLLMMSQNVHFFITTMAGTDVLFDH